MLKAKSIEEVPLQTIPVGKDHLPAERIGGVKEFASTAVDYNAFVEEAIRWLPEGEKGDAGIRSEVSELDTGSALLRGLGEKTSSSANRDHRDDVESQAQRKRVLIADDNADMRDYLRRAPGGSVSGGGRFRWPRSIAVGARVGSGFDLVRRHDAESGRVWSLASGTCGRRSGVRARGATLGAAGEEAVLEGIRAGADEYLIKPFSARELNRARGRANPA